MYNTARRIMFGKTLNSGQICISPNYILCTTETKDSLLKELEVVFKEWYDSNPKTSECYSGKMVSTRHFNRLVKLLEQTKVGLPFFTQICFTPIFYTFFFAFFYNNFLHFFFAFFYTFFFAFFYNNFLHFFFAFFYTIFFCFFYTNFFPTNIVLNFTISFKKIGVKKSKLLV